jgi:hypothetical protein
MAVNVGWSVGLEGVLEEAPRVRDDLPHFGQIDELKHIAAVDPVVKSAGGEWGGGRGGYGAHGSHLFGFLFGSTQSFPWQRTAVAVGSAVIASGHLHEVLIVWDYGLLEVVSIAAVRARRS